MFIVMLFTVFDLCLNTSHPYTILLSVSCRENLRWAGCTLRMVVNELIRTLVP